MGYDNHFTIPPTETSGGLALFWKKDIELAILASTPNFIDTKVKTRNLTFHITFVYGSPVKSKRADVWSKISELGAGRETAWLLIGEFDILVQAEREEAPTP